MPDPAIYVDVSFSSEKSDSMGESLLDTDDKIVVVHPLCQSQHSHSPHAEAFLRIPKPALTLLIEMTAKASMLVSRTSRASWTRIGTRILKISLLYLRCLFCFFRDKERKTGRMEPVSTSSHPFLDSAFGAGAGQAFSSWSEEGVVGIEAAMAESAGGYMIIRQSWPRAWCMEGALWCVVSGLRRGCGALEGAS